jgi:hypothetical protein
MFLAQGLVEYGSLAALRSGVEQIRFAALSWASSLTPTQWAFVGGGLLVVMWLWRRK